VRILLLLLLTPALFLVAACGGDGDDGNGDAGSGGDDNGAAATDRARDGNGEPQPSPGSAGPLGTVCAANPDEANDDELQIDEPLGGDPVDSPFTVRGRVAAFEATFKITLFDAAGNQLADVTGMSDEGQTLAPFQEEVSFAPVNQETPACLWVYEASARDGSPTNVLQIPIRLQP
jgi:hypothetical protein